MDEKQLIKHCIKGDSKSQRSLFEHYAPIMMAICLRYCKNRQMAEDVLQEGFIKIFFKLKDYSGAGSFEGWMKRIMVNSALDELRKDKKHSTNQDIEEQGFYLEDESFIIEEIAAADLLELVRNMPEGYRVVFNMFAVEGYSHKEIGELLEVSENTSKSQYLRARAYLRKKLEAINERREG